MTISSISSTLLPSFGISTSPSVSSNPNLISFSFPSVSLNGLKLIDGNKPSRPTRIFAATDALNSEESVSELQYGGSEAVISSVSEEVEKTTPKKKIRIRLRSYWVPLIEDSCKQITDAALTTNVKTVGPVPLPTKRRVYCVRKSPHAHKNARFHFEIRTHQRLIDILYPTPETIDSLMQLDLPAGVDVNVKL